MAEVINEPNMTYDGAGEAFLPPRRCYYPAIKRLRILLMFFMCIDLFGFPTALGALVQTVCGFAPLAFFILSGFLVLQEGADRSERIARAIRRTALVFAVMAVSYFVINFFYYRLLGANIFSAFASKRYWFNFIVLNVWQFDIGGAIWYVHALLYAYIILYFLDKWQLLRFDWLIASVLLLVAMCTGELAGLIRWEFLGYQYFPGNFFNRALPYVLLGAFISRKMAFFGALGRPWFIGGIVLGVMLSVVEMLALGVLGVPGYYGHLIGMGVIAVSVCLLALQDEEPRPGFEALFAMSRWHVNCIYYLAQPVSIVIAFLLSSIGKEVFAMSVNFMGIFTFLVCFFLAWVIARISSLFAK